MKRIHRALATAGVVAIAVSGAQAAHGKGKAKKERVRTVTYVVKGVWDADTGTVDVRRGNAHARRGGLVKSVIALDLAQARLRVADTDRDGSVGIADVVDGDRVVVQMRLPRRDPGAGPFPVRKLVDQTHPYVSADESDTESD